MSSVESEYRPQLIDEAEAMLGGSFFYDEERSTALYDDFAALASQELGARREIYIGALRTLAEVRATERSVANPVDVRAWNEAWYQQLTLRRLGAIVMDQRDALSPLSRRLAILNRAEQSLEDGVATEGLESHQLSYLQGAISDMQKASHRVMLPSWWLNEKSEHSSRGTTLTSPSGRDKLALMAGLVKVCGVGETLALSNSEWLGENPPVSMVVVEPKARSAWLLNKNSDLFGQFCPGVEVGGLYAHKQDCDADVVFASRSTFARHFVDGTLAGRRIDLLSIDEGPRFSKVAHGSQTNARKFLQNEMMTLAEIGAALNISTQFLDRYLLPEERDTMERVHAEFNQGKPLASSRAAGEAIVRRLREVLVCPEHLVLLGTVVRQTKGRSKTVQEYVSRSREILGIENLRRTTEQKRGRPALPWASAKILGDRYGAIDPVLFDFDVDALPTCKEDKDPVKLRYAHELQCRFGMSFDWIRPDEERDLPG